MTQPTASIGYEVDASGGDDIALDGDYTQYLNDFGVTRLEDLPPDVLYEIVVDRNDWGDVTLCTHCSDKFTVDNVGLVYRFRVGDVEYTRRDQNDQWRRTEK